MFAEYYKEREDLECEETENGFALYSFLDIPKCVYITDIYVKKEVRNKKEASKLADKIVDLAKDKGYSLLLGSVCIDTNNYETSIKVLEAYGMQQAYSENSKIYFVKEI